MVSMSAEPSPSGARVTTTADAHARLVARAGPFAASVFVSLALIAVPDERGVLVAATTTRALAGQLGVAKDTAAGALAILMRRGYLRRLAQPRSGGTELSAPLQFLAQRLRKTTLVFLVSDFLQGDIVRVADVQVLGHRHDLVPIIVEDRLEETLWKARGHVRLRDLESGEERVISLSARNRRTYAEEVTRRRGELIRHFYSLGLDHVYLRVGDSFVDPLIRVFSSRKRQQR